LKLDLLFLGGAPLPVKHLKGLPVDQSSAAATRAATTFQRGRVLPRPDAFAEARPDAHGRNDNGHFGGGAERRPRRRTELAGDDNGDDDVGFAAAARTSSSASSSSSIGGSIVRRSEVLGALAARLRQGPRLGGRRYPSTDAVAGTGRGQPLTEIDLSFQGLVLSVEDCVVVAALVEENYSLEALRLNSHRPLPVQSLRGDDGLEVRG
jgi:hypothetical protein